MQRLCPTSTVHHMMALQYTRFFISILMYTIFDTKVYIAKYGLRIAMQKVIIIIMNDKKKMSAGDGIAICNLCLQQNSR